LRTFTPLTPEDDAEERFGWCALGSPTDLELGVGKVFEGPYLTLGFRHDKWRLPSALLNSQLAEAAQETRAKTGQERLSKNQKDALKLRVIQRLKRKLMPSMRQIDLVWHLDRGELFFWSQSPGVHEKMRALFETTFGLDLALNSPYLAALELLPNKGTEELLSKLNLTQLHTTARGGL
jgi:recombination associated protein RdgC